MLKYLSSSICKIKKKLRSTTFAISSLCKFTCEKWHVVVSTGKGIIAMKFPRRKHEVYVEGWYQTRNSGTLLTHPFLRTLAYPRKLFDFSRHNTYTILSSYTRARSPVGSYLSKHVRPRAWYGPRWIGQFWGGKRGWIFRWRSSGRISLISNSNRTIIYLSIYLSSAKLKDWS